MTMPEFTGYGPKYEHIIKTRVADAIAGAETLELAVEYVMEALNEARIVSYSKGDRHRLLTQSGRVFILMIEKPNSTQLEIATRLGIREQNVQRIITKLIADGLIERHKSGRTNVYTPCYDNAWKHPDIWRFALAILRMTKEQPDGPY